LVVTHAKKKGDLTPAQRRGVNRGRRTDGTGVWVRNLKLIKTKEK